MRVIRSVLEMKDISSMIRGPGQKVGFVPTMGALHEGHLTLIRRSKTECDHTVVSIFVNPIQFNPGEDLEKYPRNIEKDVQLLEKDGADALFLPDSGDMFPEGFSTYVDVGPGLTGGLCGVSRPGHFRGVATVVAKLFNIVAPDISYFGEKDAQQAAVIKKMVRDMEFRTELRILPTVREPDGLAMSSRNAYLSADDRRRAGVIYRSLEAARQKAALGERKALNIKNIARSVLGSENGLRVDYIEVVDKESLEPVDDLNGEALLMVAVFVGGTRLIDNMVINT